MAKHTTYITNKQIFFISFIMLCIILPFGLITEYYYMPFALIAAVVVGSLIIFKPFVGLIIYSVFLLIRPQEFISVIEHSPIPIERSIAALLILSILLKIIKNGFHHKFTRIDYSIIAFIIACSISIIGSIYITQSIDTWNIILRLFIIYIFIILLIESKRQMKLFILFIIFSSVFHAFASVINYSMGNFTHNVAMNIDRAVGIDQSLSGPNSLAATLVYTLPFIYYYYISDCSKSIKFMLVATTPVIILCIVLTGSRTGMLGFIFFVLLILWKNKNKVRNIAIAVFLMLTIWIFMPGQYKERFASTTDLSSGTASAHSAHARLDGLIKGVKMVIDRPLTGYGIGNYTTASGMIYSVGDWHDAHSLPGQVLGEIGILGTSAFILWIYTLFKIMTWLERKYKNNKDNFYYLTIIGLRLQLLCLLFMGIAGHNLYRHNWYIISALVVVMMKASFLSDGKIENHDQLHGQVENKPEIEIPVKD